MVHSMPFKVINDSHSWMYRRHNLQRLSAHLNIPFLRGGVGGEENLACVRSLSKFGGCLSDNTVRHCWMTVLIRSFLEFCSKSLQSETVWWLSKLLLKVVINGNVLFFGFGLGAGPCNLYL